MTRNQIAQKLSELAIPDKVSGVSLWLDENGVEGEAKQKIIADLESYPEHYVENTV